MNYTAEITVDSDIEILHNAFLSEIGEKNRSKIIMHKKNDKLTFEISASDSIALRASLNSITKLLTVYEKTKKVYEDEYE